jgi:hypothetical protein
MARQKKTAKKEDRMKYSYGWQKLHTGTMYLVGPEDQRTRLINAVSILVHIHSPEYENHIPPEILDEFRAFMQEMTSVPPVATEGAIAATINSLDDNAVNERAQQFLHFYDTVCRHCSIVD